MSKTDHLDKISIKNFIKKIKHPLYLDFATYKLYGRYFALCDVDVRTSYRKAQSLKYFVKQISTLSHADIASLYAIWTSCDERQNRPINLNYETISGKNKVITPTEWPVPDYSIYNRECGLSFWGCFDANSNLVAYLELVDSNRLSTVHSTLGHFDHLKRGVMKYMFCEVIKSRWDSTSYLAYGPSSQFSFFKSDLLINAADEQSKLITESIR